MTAPAADTGVDAAVAAADRAMRHAGVTVRALHSIDDLDAVRAVFDATWPIPGAGTTMELNLMRALEHAGSYVAAAYGPDGGAPIAGAVAFVGRHREADGAPGLHLHSHMAAALPGWQDRGVGTALKLHQRAWALREGIPVITWTFDPLVRRNARLNVRKLGAGVSEYLADFYGEMVDEINAGDRTDRLMAWWEVGSQRAATAAGGELPAVVPSPQAVVIELPEDIVAIRSASPQEALAWRLRVREQWLGAATSGHALVGLDETGGYVLEPRVP